MAISRISDLRETEIGSISEQNLSGSYMEISELSTYNGEGGEYDERQKILSRKVSYVNIRDNIENRVEQRLSGNMLNLGAQRKEEEYIFPVSVDEQRRAYVQTCRDDSMQSQIDFIRNHLSSESWEFVIRKQDGTDSTIRKYVVVNPSNNI